MYVISTLKMPFYIWNKQHSLRTAVGMNEFQFVIWSRAKLFEVNTERIWTRSNERIRQALRAGLLILYAHVSSTPMHSHEERGQGLIKSQVENSKVNPQDRTNNG